MTAMPNNVKGRPLVTSQESGPDTKSVTFTTIRLAPARPEDTRHSVSDLPPRIAGNVTVDDTSGCWVVSPGNGIYLDRDGYARLGGEGVHRIAYRMLIGEIPADRPVIDHVKARGCIWRNCAFVGHLEACTIRANTLRGASFAAVNYLKTHCGRCGAAFDLFNTYVAPSGRRDCRACGRRRVREYTERVKAGQPVKRRRDLGQAA